MRNAARFVLVAALAATILPTSSANAAYCGKLDPVCDAVCQVGYALGFQCVD